MADTTTTVYHPTIPDISREVPTADVAKWTNEDNGWLKSAPSNAAVTETRKATAKARRADVKAFSTADAVTPGVPAVSPVDPNVHSVPEA